MVIKKSVAAQLSRNNFNNAPLFSCNDQKPLTTQLVSDEETTPEQGVAVSSCQLHLDESAVWLSIS